MASADTADAACRTIVVGGTAAKAEYELTLDEWHDGMAAVYPSAVLAGHRLLDADRRRTNAGDFTEIEACPATEHVGDLISIQTSLQLRTDLLDQLHRHSVHLTFQFRNRRPPRQPSYQCYIVTCVIRQ